MGKYNKYLLLLAVGIGGYLIYTKYKKNHPAELKTPKLTESQTPEQAIAFMTSYGYTDKEIREYLSFRFPDFVQPLFFLR